MKKWRYSWLVILVIASLSCLRVQAQDSLRVQTIAKGVSFRGISAPNAKVCWVSGSKGNIWRTTNGGRHWEQIPSPAGDSLDFRDVQAFGKKEAFLMSAGEGSVSRIYHTTDAGQHWELQFKMDSAKGFLDGMAFWDAEHGIVVGDPLQGSLDLLSTTDGGAHWMRHPMVSRPPVEAGEYVFAASGTSIDVLRNHVWIGTGGTVARVFHSADRGKTWESAATPMVQGTAAQGIFSVCFWDELHGLAAGGDYEHDELAGPHLLATQDGGKTWTVQSEAPFLSCVEAAPVGVTMVGSSTYHFMPLEGGCEGSGKGFHTATISGDQRAMYAAGASGRVGVLPLPRRMARQAAKLAE
jgi:photosystem II stability/assembly factor-like uncharacterized protein